MTQNAKTELEGELFILVEEVENEGEEDVKISAEINGFNIWDWLSSHNGDRVKVILEAGDALKNVEEVSKEEWDDRFNTGKGKKVKK